MLSLLQGGTEETFGVIERELRCGFWSLNLRATEMHWSRGYFDLLGIEPGKVSPSFAAILQVTHPLRSRITGGGRAHHQEGVHDQAQISRYPSGRQYRLDLLPDHRFR